jgi:hypothetical protein
MAIFLLLPLQLGYLGLGRLAVVSQCRKLDGVLVADIHEKDANHNKTDRENSAKKDSKHKYFPGAKV